MTTWTAVTDEAGAYRFSAVPPGDYTLSFELAGFGTVVREASWDSSMYVTCFNANAEQTLSTGSGASWLRPTAITGPRVLWIGARLDW